MAVLTALWYIGYGNLNWHQMSPFPCTVVAFLVQNPINLLGKTYSSGHSRASKFWVLQPLKSQASDIDKTNLTILSGFTTNQLALLYDFLFYGYDIGCWSEKEAKKHIQPLRKFWFHNLTASGWNLNANRLICKTQYVITMFEQIASGWLQNPRKRG